MVTVFVICWGPYAAQSLAGVLGYVSWFVTKSITVILSPLISESSPRPHCVSSTIRQARHPGQPRHLRRDEQGGQIIHILYITLLLHDIYIDIIFLDYTTYICFIN